MSDLDILLERARLKATDAEFRAWVQKQPSCISGQFSEWVDGEGRNPACHVRRAKESGIGFKGEYACVPMLQREHLAQHALGEARFLCDAGILAVPSPSEAKDWFNQKRVEYLTRWLES